MFPCIYRTATAIVISFVVFLGTVVKAQEQSGQGSPVRGITELLKLPSVRADLEVVDFQKEMIDKALTDFQKANRDFAMAVEAGSPNDRASALAEFKAARARIEAELAASLLPEQLNRLKQIRMNYIADQGGSSYGLNNREFLAELGITDAQRAEIDAKAAEVEKAVQEKIKKLQAEIQQIKIDARNDVIQILTPDQRKKYLELVGRPFDPAGSK